MRFHSAALVVLLSFLGVRPALGQENIKTFTYSKTKQADLRILVHFPPWWKATDKRPGIVFFFGGGWKNGTIREFERQAQYLAGRGMVAARADYRVKSRHGVTPKECVDDARAAIRWFRKNAGKLGVDPERIVASGDSSGAHIAACTTLMPESQLKDEKVSCKANALILFNPPLRFPSQLLKDIDDAEEVAKSISPIRHLMKDSPPILLFYGTEDWLLRHGEEFMRRSKELGHRAELFTAEKQGHSFFHRSPWLERTMQRADEFLVSLEYLPGDTTTAAPSVKKVQPKARPRAKPAAPRKTDERRTINSFTQASPGKRDSILFEPPRGIAGEIGEDHVRAGAFDAR